jgi:hypothetical protein
MIFMMVRYSGLVVKRWFLKLAGSKVAEIYQPTAAL